MYSCSYLIMETIRKLLPMDLDFAICLFYGNTHNCFLSESVLIPQLIFGQPEEERSLSVTYMGKVT